MTKKQTRPNLPQETLERARREMGQWDSLPSALPVTPAAEAVHVAHPAHAVHPARTVDLRRQYVYVLTDLKNMAMLAAALLLVLLVLSFVI